jgi:hypothetical protein
LFYHGFGASWHGGADDCEIGVAIGTDLRYMKRYVGNPVLKTGAPGTWDAGTVGRRSIRQASDGFYYMAYEGSTEQPYDKASWSTGVARSSDLLHWTKFNLNPVLPRTQTSFGYDGPELEIESDGSTCLYFRGPSSWTQRALLVWN